MRSSRRPHRLPGHFAWLFWLALLLPVGQGLAAAHELSHVEFDGSDGARKSLHISHCEWCPIAAAICSGALPSHLPVAMAPGSQADAVPMWSCSTRASATVLGYCSRGPPLA